MTREEAVKEIEKAFEPAFANYIITALTEGATVSDKEPMVEIDLYSVIKQKYIEREVLDRIRAEIEWLKSHRAQFLTSDNKVCIDSQEVLNVIDKYKAETEVDNGNED